MKRIDGQHNDILIVDDTPENLTVLRRILKQNSYRVHPVLSGELALKVVQKALPDLILLDIIMPEGMDGYEVCRHLKADERTRDIPVLFISALDGAVDKMRAFEAGGVDYIAKPFHAEEVLARVETHLNLQNVRKQLVWQNSQLQQEVTDRKRVEKQLRESEERFRGFSEATFEGIIIHHDGRILDINQAIITMFGYQRSDLIDKSVFEFLTPECRDNALANMRAGYNEPYEVAAFHKDGPVFPIEIQARTMPFPLREGQQHSVRIVAVRDISKRKHAEETLRQLKKAIETTGVGITITDSEGNIVYTNPADAHMHGYTIPELVGQPSNIFTTPEYRQGRKRDEGSDAFHHWERERLNMRKDGSIFPAKLTSSPIHDTRKMCIGTVTVCEDISERKKVEEELKKAKEEAEAANRAKSIFLTNMSHELRTPLNAILGFTQILSHGQISPEELREYLDIIMRSGEHLLTLINQVLDFSKIEAGRITIDEKEFDLHLLLRLLEDMLSLKARHKGIHLSFTHTANVPRVIRTDELKLRQTFINLLNNAIKFTKEGQVQVFVDCKPLFFESDHQDPDHCLLCCEIRDTGPGIAPEETERLFEAFFQAENGRQGQEGTGLGLSISRKFVQLLGGDIQVKSEPGKGSVFSFEISVGRGEPSTTIEARSAITKRAVSLEPHQPYYRLLIVDDNADNRKLLVTLLVPFGFDIREASNGQQAVAIWEEWEPHAIFLDLRMPVMDGFKTTQRIKMTSQGKQTIVIGLSASILDEDQEAAFTAGCDGFLRKPFRDHDIFALLRTLLGVRFLYEDTAALEDETASQAAREALTPEALAVLPVELREQLEFATLTTDLTKMLALFTKIRDYEPKLAECLESLTKNFEYMTILEVLQQLKRLEQ